MTPMHEAGAEHPTRSTCNQLQEIVTRMLQLGTNGTGCTEIEASPLVAGTRGNAIETATRELLLQARAGALQAMLLRKVFFSRIEFYAPQWITTGAS